MAVPQLAGKLGGIQYGQAARSWTGGGFEWDVVAGATGQDGILLGEVKWLRKVPTRTELQAIVAGLRSKGVPAACANLPGPVRHAVFVPRMPSLRGQGMPADLFFVEAADVLGVLR